MLRDLKVYSIIYVLCLLAFTGFAYVFALITENTPPSLLTFMAQLVAPAMTGQLHLKNRGTSPANGPRNGPRNGPSNGYCFKFAFFGSLLSVVLSCILVLLMFMGMSFYYTSTPTDGFGFLWVMTGLASVPAMAWLVGSLIVIVVATIINFTMFKIGIMVMRWTRNKKMGKTENLASDNRNQPQ